MGGELVQGSGAVEGAGDEAVERCGEIVVGGGPVGFEGEAAEEEGAEVVDVFAAEVGAGGFGGEFSVGEAFTDAVGAEFYGFADGEDVAGLDVFVDEIAGVEGLEGGEDGFGDLKGFGGGEGAFVEDVAKVGVVGLHEGVGEGDAFEGGLADLFDFDEVVLVDFRDVAPAVEELGFVEVGFGEADDGGVAVFVGGGEEAVAAFGAEEFAEGVVLGDGAAFVFGPEMHGCAPFFRVWGGPGRRRALPVRGHERLGGSSSWAEAGLPVSIVNEVGWEFQGGAGRGGKVGWGYLGR